MWVTLPVKNQKKNTFYANLERSRELSSEQKENMFNMFETTKVSLTAAPFKFLKANPDIPNKKQHRFQSISGNLLLIQLLKRQILSTISSPKRWKCGKKPWEVRLDRMKMMKKTQRQIYEVYVMTILK